MSIPTEITFHQMDPSDAVETAIQRWVTRLEHVCDRILNCHVTISQPHKRHRHGGEFAVNVLLSIPGPDIATTLRHEDIYVAIADAFRAARRQLIDELDVNRGYVKTHVVGREGKVGHNVNKHRTAS